MISLNVVVLASTFLFNSSAVGPQQSGAGPQQVTPAAGVVTLIGCVERLPATPAGRGTSTPAYKLIDVQPGAGTRLTWKPDAQFQLVASEPPATSIDFATFQNQRVEVVGTMSPTPPSKPDQAAKPGAPPANLPVVRVKAVKSVSTECK